MKVQRILGRDIDPMMKVQRILGRGDNAIAIWFKPNLQDTTRSKVQIQSVLGRK